jgi:hypothetical protein
MRKVDIMPIRTAGRTVAAGVLAGLLSVVGGCADAAAPAPAPIVPAASSADPPPSAPTTTAPARAGRDDSGRDGPGGGRHGRGGAAGGARAGATLPADFPSDVSLPPGELLATSGSDGQWSALLRVPGSAADALRAAMQFYVAAGFTQDGASTAHRGPVAITLVTENRDHSPTSTNLAVGVAER